MRDLGYYIKAPCVSLFSCLSTGLFMGKTLTEKELKELTEKLAHDKLSNIIRTPQERQKQAAEHGPMHWWVGSVGTGAGTSLQK